MNSVSALLLVGCLLMLLNIEDIQSKEIRLFRSRRDDSHKPSSSSTQGNSNHEAHWDYRKKNKNSILPPDWYKSHPNCKGTRQSPINVQFDDSEYDRSFKDITIREALTQYNATELEKIKSNEHVDDNPFETEDYESWNFTNNGHTIKMIPNNREYTVALGPEQNDYKLQQMHFHWRDSEHSINGKLYDAELHMVHQSTVNKNEFAVIGFLFSASGNHINKDLDPVIDQVDSLQDANTNSQSSRFELLKLIPQRIRNYYNYPGSLTTPGCDEVVDWFLVSSPILKISHAQLLEFQSTRDSSGREILTNNRAIQELKGRVVKRSFHIEKKKSQLLANADLQNNSSPMNFANPNFILCLGFILSVLLF